MIDNIGVFTNPQHDLFVAPCEPKIDNLVCGADEVLLNVRATGICGSDVHFWKEGRVGDTMVVRKDHILGHESAGEVLKVGTNVSNVKPGDRVAIEPGEQCLVCEFCLLGQYNACESVKFKSTPPYDGLLRRYLAHPARLCHKIGDLSYEEGALLEPVSVGLAAIEQAGLCLGDPTVICGAGPIGIVTAILARAAGAAPLVITDINEHRLKVAQTLVKNIRTIKIDPAETPEVAASRIVHAAGQKLKVALECTGFEQSIATAIFSLTFRGTCEVVGVGKDYANLPFMHMSVNEVTLRGLFRYANTWPKAIRLVQDAVIDVKGLVTHRYSIEEALEAFKSASTPSANAIKVVITS